MDVSVSSLRSELASWISRVADGEEVVITDRGVPVARLVPIGSAPLIEELTRRGVLRPPRTAQRTRIDRADLIRASGSISDLLSEQRD
ncbi:MAG TPA: type II toxin-antitoxin system prevent-host-death family antitoxin [Mycobacteriales bacterium]|nr:type II toxin-antitoxin system prevent-host-death family antitoxin [Mycobacteriales bacterium]